MVKIMVGFEIVLSCYHIIFINDKLNKLFIIMNINLPMK